MSLCGNEPRMLRNLNHLYDSAVRRGTAELHAALGERSAEVVVDLITVSVSLMDLLSTVYLVCLGGLVQNTRIRTKT